MKVKVSQGGQRLDIFLAEHFAGGHTRSQITNSIKAGRTTLNGKVVKAGTILDTGDLIEADIERSDLPAKPEVMNIDVVYEDDHLMIINKPRGMVVHPGAANRSGTLLNGLLHRASLRETSTVRQSQTDYVTGQSLDRAGIVHRLDKNTAGLMVVAKTAAAQTALSAMFERHEVRRTYVGLVEGILNGEGTIDTNIVRDPNHRTLYKAGAGGRRAITHYKVLRVFSKWTLVRFNLETGRTHQIRVHCKSIGHPLVGDPEYNPSSSIKTGGQLLESVEISFTHPITGVPVHRKVAFTELFDGVIGKIY